MYPCILLKPSPCKLCDLAEIFLIIGGTGAADK